MPVSRHSEPAKRVRRSVSPSEKDGSPRRRGMTGRESHVAARPLMRAVSGDFGKETLAALKAFQAAHGLKADGICGPKTWKKIEVVQVDSL